MLRYVYGHDLHRFPLLRDSMFRDRAAQFAIRHGWEVSVDAFGQERDQYDDLDPLYVIWEAEDGTHGGSIRLLPTTGRCMVNEHFLHLTEGVRVESPLIWECTRFCVSPRATGTAARNAAAGLVLGAGEIMERNALEHYVGVIYSCSERIYRYYGVAPTVVGSAGEGRRRLLVGLWEMHGEDTWRRLLGRLGIDRATSRAWLANAFAAMAPAPRPNPFARAPETKELALAG